MNFIAILTFGVSATAAILVFVGIWMMVEKMLGVKEKEIPR